jgi:hypothetical protein
LFNRSTHTKDEGIDRHYGIWAHGSSFGLGPDATPAEEVDASIVRNLE